MSLSLEKLFSHDEVETYKIKKNLNAKVRLGTESESSYSITNSRNFKEVQPRDSSYETLAAFKILLRCAISLSTLFAETSL